MNTILDTILADPELDDELFWEDRYDARDALEDHEVASGAIAVACDGHLVRTALGVAVTYAKLASQRLNSLSSRPVCQQRSEWNAGAEKTWFGPYDSGWSGSARLRNITTRMFKMVRTLDSALLEIDCNWKKKWISKSVRTMPAGGGGPVVPRIILGRGWRDLGKDDVRKTQTFIREAARLRHALAGRYDTAAAKRRARNFPGSAIRSAENIGYYAVCRASNAYGCS